MNRSLARNDPIWFGPIECEEVVAMAVRNCNPERVSLVPATWLARRELVGALLLPFLIESGLILAGQGAWVGSGWGWAGRELAFVLALFGFFLINIQTLRHIDFERRRASDSLRTAHESLQVKVAEQARIEEELRASERRYRFLADAMPQMVWTATAAGEVEYCNERWFRYTGQSMDESRGWGWSEILHPDDTDRCAQRWTQAFESGEPYEIAYRLRRADGHYHWHLGRADPMRDASGAIVRWFGTCTDIDDQKRIEAELRSIQEGLSDRISERTAALEAANLALLAEVAERKLAEEAAQAASRAKGEFLANMSHEIRTPMNGILGMIELALSTALTPTQREYLTIVASSADALLTVINDILDFSKIEAGKLELDPVPFPIRDAATDTLRTLVLRAHDKGLELACQIAPDVPRTVIGDSGRLRQVLVNLIGNAIKFTDRGEVVVAVNVVSDSGGRPTDPRSIVLHFAVSDTGIGIPPDKRVTIFDPFEQADGSTTRRFGGTGLGLSISAKLVGLMGGTIRVNANPGGGSIFEFDARFDRDMADPPDVAPTHALALDALRVLVVDDNATNRRIAVESLQQWGCRPGAVASGLEALAEVQRAANQGEPYSVALIDFMMPGMDGLELGRRLRAGHHAASPGSNRLKLVMLTSGGLDGADRADANPFDHWLAKPVRQSELLNLLLELLAGSDLNLNRDRALPGVAPSPTPLPTPPDSRSLNVLLAEDHPINQRVATRMLEDLGHRVTVVGDGRAAMESATSNWFDLVLMDVQMPNMDGFEALAAIRGSELLAATSERATSATTPLPIIALTAHAMIGDRERCLNAGFDDYLSKPVNAARLRTILDRFSPRLAPAEPPIMAKPTEFDRGTMVADLGGNEALVDEMIRLFLAETPHLLVEIHAAIRQHNQPALIRLGHTLAGVASNFGRNNVVTAARQIEKLAQTEPDQAAVEAAAAHLNHAFEQLQLALLARAEVCS